MILETNDCRITAFQKLDKDNEINIELGNSEEDFIDLYLNIENATKLKDYLTKQIEKQHENKQ